MGLDAMIFVFWMLSFKPAFSLYSFTLIKRLFSSFSLPTIRVVSSAYLRLLIFLLAILILACASSSPPLLIMYSACKLNKQGNNIQPWCTPFLIWNQSVVPCPVLTVASDLLFQISTWNSPGKKTGVSCHFHLQGIFPTQGSNPGLLNFRQILYHLSLCGSQQTVEIF